MSENFQQHKKRKFDDYQESSFRIFMEFFPNLTCFKEPQKDDDSKEIQEKKFQKEIHRKYYWPISMREKINSLSVLSGEVKSQYEKAVQEKKEIEKKGHGNSFESTLLLIRFETMLNAVYSLCDNLAFVGYKLHPGIKRSFNEQWKKIRKSRNYKPEYSEYLEIIGSTDWYEILHNMRSESIHYLNGFVFHSPTGLGVLYQHMEHLDNTEEADKKIEIENILEYTNSLLEKINGFLEDYGKYYLDHFIDEKNETFHPCLIPAPENKGFLAGGRKITLSEYLKKQPGKCINNFECPNRSFCPAFQKRVDQ
jgi:hypothetical protein